MDSNKAVEAAVLNILYRELARKVRRFPPTAPSNTGHSQAPPPPAATAAARRH